MTLLFPGLSEGEFDFQADWLVKAQDKERMTILFEGQGLNSDLELVLDFKANPEMFETFSVGDLVKLPDELFVETEAEESTFDYQNY